MEKVNKNNRIDFMKMIVQHKNLGGMSIAPNKEDEEEEAKLALENYDDGELESDTGEKEADFISKDLQKIVPKETLRVDEKEYFLTQKERKLLQKEVELYRKRNQFNFNSTNMQ